MIFGCVVSKNRDRRKMRTFIGSSTTHGIKRLAKLHFASFLKKNFIFNARFFLADFFGKKVRRFSSVPIFFFFESDFHCGSLHTIHAFEEKK